MVPTLAPHSHDPNPDGTGHTHGVVDPTITSSERGLWAVKWSFVGLVVTAIAQMGVFWLSGSVALMADLIHNVGDAMTALPLGVAFLIGRRPPSDRFTYGYGRLEDLAGVAVVGMIFFSALITAYESIHRVFYPQPLTHLGALAMAAIIGFVGNELVALFRIRVGREINSGALVADGLHARADGLVSLVVLISALGVGLGYDWVDPVMGLVITLILLKIVWESAITVFSRLLDGIGSDVLEQLHHALSHRPQGVQLNSLRARWLGHRLYVEVELAMAGELTIDQAQAVIKSLEKDLHNHLPYLGAASMRMVALEPQKDSSCELSSASR
ncbi:MAG: cation diffusion facilitator family transporter [Nodosilinea sp. LVE1205-7]|jgi:cation diffusion facilitator family transporter